MYSIKVTKGIFKREHTIVLKGSYTAIKKELWGMLASGKIHSVVSISEC